MVMTYKLAKTFMDCFGALMISANGRMPETEEEFKAIEDYGKNSFQAIAAEWEEAKGEKWEISMEEESPQFSVEQLTTIIPDLMEETIRDIFGGIIADSALEGFKEVILDNFNDFLESMKPKVEEEAVSEEKDSSEKMD